jgi:hypothetical protein
MDRVSGQDVMAGGAGQGRRAVAALDKARGDCGLVGSSRWRSPRRRLAIALVAGGLLVTACRPASSAPPPPTSVPPASSASIAVYAGYADTHHAVGPATPSPWQGSPNVVFVGQADSASGGWDASAVRIDNLSTRPLINVTVSVDMGSDHFALWGQNSIPAGGSLILTQTGFQNFDGSDFTNTAGCYGCDPTLCLTSISTIVPVVHVTIGTVTTDVPDNGRILNTGGVDSAGCPPTGQRNDEFESWQPIAPPLMVLVP